jgi:uncharacterized protein (UPF0261 family)
LFSFDQYNRPKNWKMERRTKAAVIVLVGALDTKGKDFQFVRERILAEGIDVLVIDIGVVDEPYFHPDITNAQVAFAGGSRIEWLRANKEKTEAMRVMTAGAVAIVKDLHQQGRLQGILGMGGTGGTAIASACMRSLPIGLPKVLVSTAGSGDMSAYLAFRDIIVFPSLVDVAGINRISRAIYANAAAAIVGMVRQPNLPDFSDRPLIAASMFGNTTPCVERAKAVMEQSSYEVLVFHATGAGGRAMLSLCEDGLLTGLLDLTTTEFADEVCGGVFSAGRTRVQMGSRRPIPIVIAPGCVDMCNFGALDSVPAKYRSRRLYEWNSNVTLMRTNTDENHQIGELIAETANLSAGPVMILLPMRGVSMLDAKGEPFWDEEADAACYSAIRCGVRPDVPIIEVDTNINDPEFADRAASGLLEMIQDSKTRTQIALL